MEKNKIYKKTSCGNGWFSDGRELHGKIY